jgi:CubicO group peptidase (beta-lactamase class C family)
MTHRWSALLAPLAGLGLLAVPWHTPTERARASATERSAAKAAQKPPPVPAGKGQSGFPITGKAPAVLAPLDAAVVKVMHRHGVPGLSLAVVKDGKLIVARGYGWEHFETNTPGHRPNALRPGQRFQVLHRPGHPQTRRGGQAAPRSEGF